MSDADRINRILFIIKKIWETEPDFPFFQVIYRLQHMYSDQNNDFGRVEMPLDENNSMVGYDFYTLGDEELEEFLIDLMPRGK